MPIAGALIVPINKEVEPGLQSKLAAVSGIEVQDIGPKGIAIILEAANSGELKQISHDIEKWEDVLEFELAYFNWEDETE
ncbi:MAG: chaperone NapD [Desulfobulbaceae bacterium]|nr:chaperone NapD [Desulfobulbaceae bacterium]